MRTAKKTPLTLSAVAPITTQKTGELAQVFETSALAFGEISGDIVDALSDKKLTTQEAIEVLFDLPDVISAVKSVSANRRKFRTLSEAEQNGVYAALSQRLNQSTENAAKIVAAIIDFAAFAALTIDKGNSKIVAIKKLFKPAAVVTGEVA